MRKVSHREEARHLINQSSASASSTINMWRQKERIQQQQQHQNQNPAAAASSVSSDVTPVVVMSSFVVIQPPPPLHAIYCVGGGKQESTPVKSYPDISDLRLIRMHLGPPFSDDQSFISGSYLFLIIRTSFIRPWLYELGGFNCSHLCSVFPSVFSKILFSDNPLG